MSKQNVAFFLCVLLYSTMLSAGSPVAALAQGDWVISSMIENGDTTECLKNCVTISFKSGNMVEIVNSAGNSSEMNWIIIDSTLKFIKPAKASAKSGSTFSPGTFVLKDNSSNGTKELLMIHQKYGYTYILTPITAKTRSTLGRR